MSARVLILLIFCFVSSFRLFIGCVLTFMHAAKITFSPCIATHIESKEDITLYSVEPCMCGYPEIEHCHPVTYIGLRHLTLW